MTHKLISVVAVIFGVITLIASSRILYLDADPGYLVFMPLLIFNHIMGFSYLTAGYLIWNNSLKGQLSALIIFLVNLGVLIIISILYLLDSGVATDSIGAMIFRTVVWMLIYLGLKFTGQPN